MMAAPLTSVSKVTYFSSFAGNEDVGNAQDSNDDSWIFINVTSCTFSVSVTYCHDVFWCL